MKVQFNSISVKLAFVYVILAFFNISFFTFMIFENEMDLIAENNKYKAKEIIYNLSAVVNKFAEKVAFKSKKKKEKKKIINGLISIIEPLAPNYLLFYENGKIARKSGKGQIAPKEHKVNIQKAMANKEFTGKSYYFNIDEKKYIISIYFPIIIPRIKNMVLYFEYNIDEISDKLSDLYRLSALVIVLIVFFHLLFAVILHFLIIRPINLLHRQSKQLSDGNFEARVTIKQNDEIGFLAKSFNEMADSVQEKIERIEDLLITDALTQLFNRRYLFDKLKDETSKAIQQKSGIGLILLDIDHFKKFNDNYGHSIGDEVLKQVAATMKRVCGDRGICARYGGEELVVICPNYDTQSTFDLAEEIRKAIEVEKLSTASEEILSITVSAGVSGFNYETLVNVDQLDRLDKLLNFPDTALYKAKNNGRNRTEIFLFDTQQDEPET